ncbi:TPA: hypothetical protein SMQ45_003009 [Proteus mirabilis]|uniref:hypothetical protein n=1 Tax=Proteus mirabilis TaxID=584 RepID=UPI002575E72F|nr:hypothetical protein [Proteus mirabilis]MDM3736401.1 hypothetical protein [Proteus mirabilis]HEK1127736.1 hypothetical protein [Proteus mirabilis]HEK1185054.1 hypothetical protein [Proteus mirabilis]HEK1975258.1 hypothetical protein [Proteus mirabilis]
MNSRDWVDWITFGASVLSALSLIATLGIYLHQKKSERKKQQDIDNKILPFILLKSDSILSMLSSVSRDMSEIENYSHIEIEGCKLTLYFPKNIQGNFIDTVNLKCDLYDDFINKNRVLLSKELYLFTIELDQLHSKAISEIHNFLNLWSHYRKYIEDTEGKGLSKEELIISIKNELTKCEQSIIKQKNIVFYTPKKGNYVS